MSYTINHYNGDFAVTVQDGTVDSTYAVKLIGKNYAGYGEIHNENFLALLENFAGGNEPGRKTAGQLWYNSSTKKLKFFDGGKFKNTGGAEISETPPLGLVEGDLWYKPATKQLFSKTAVEGEFSLIGPQAAGTLQTEMFSREVYDTSNTLHKIIQAIVGDQTVFIISQDPTFTLDNEQNGGAIDGFVDIHPGLTLANTTVQDDTNVDYGVTDGALASDAFRFFGTATNADKLGGILAENYVRGDQQSSFSQLVRFADAGFTVGDNELVPGLLVDIYQSEPRIQSKINTLRLQTMTGVTPRTALVLTGIDTLPDTDSTANLGSSAKKFAYVYANQFKGIADNADALKVGGSYRIATVDTAGVGSSNTVAVRDGNGNLNATVFQGTATSANYADLAEKYLADADYEVGTVLMIGGDKEVTACQVGFRAVGPVSANPAYMMNSELEGGTYVALKGRVPVKVTGNILKGQRLVAGANGTAQAAMGNNADVFAIALESNSDEGVKLVEAIIL